MSTTATQQIQEAALNYSRDAAQAMTNFAQNALNYANTAVDMSAWWTPPQYIWGYTGGAGQPPANIVPPSVSATKPTAVALSALHNITLPSEPTLVAAAPVVTVPAAPSSILPAAPGATPEFNAPTLPTKPTLSLPSVPTFTPVAIPAAPALENPVFTAMLPDDTLVAPSNTFDFVEQEYRSALLDELKAKLMKDLVEGGYGIETQDEEALWERTRERELQNMETMIQDIARQAAARGLMIPPGSMQTLIQQAQQDAAEKISSVSRDIAIKRADMYVENRKFTIQEVRQVEDMLIRMFGFMMERALNAAKAIVELGIAAFNARLAQHNYRLERYRAAASVYEALIRGQLTKLEQYKATVEAARLSTEQQRIHAEVYRIQLDGVNALANLYRTEMDAAKTQAEVEQLKLQAFRTNVDAYTAQVGAKTAEFGMYEARIRGELAKVNVFDAQVRAYSTEVGAYKTKVDAQEVLVRAGVQANTQRIEAYRADVQRYSAELQASQQELQAAISKYEADVRKYSVTADAQIRASQQNVEAGKANADIAVAQAQVLAGFATHAGQVLATQANASASTMANIAHSYGTVSAAALSAAQGIEASITSQ